MPDDATRDTLARLAVSSATPGLEFAYVDETGDKGPVVNGGSLSYTLGCVLVPANEWTLRLKLMTDLRREFRSTYNIRLRDELKANYVLKSRGPLLPLSLGDGQLRDIYRRSLTALTVVSTGVFAIVIDKRNYSRTPYEPERHAWEFLLQRLRIRSEQRGHPIMLVHDMGDNDNVRAIHRKFRQHSYAPGGIRVQSPLLIEDPVPRDSQSSYFIQSADFVAYSAFRKIVPPGARIAKVCDQTMWDSLAPVWRSEVSNSRSDAIVVWP